MDRRKHYLIGLDTETCNGIKEENNKLNLSYSLVYDIGWVVTDKKGNIYETRSYIVDEIYNGMKDVMSSAYYAEKLPRYDEQIAKGERIVATLYEIRKQLLKDMADYDTNTVFAHNANFDLNALNVTQRYLTKSKYRYFFPYGTELWDTLKMASDTFGKMKTYQNWCVDNGYLTKHRIPRPRLTAEILYRFILQDMSFEESHTGLEDVLIETVIMAECFRKHKKMRKKLFE